MWNASAIEASALDFVVHMINHGGNPAKMWCRFSGSGIGPGLCISNKLPDDTHTAGEDHTFQGTRSHESPSKHLLFKPGLRSSSCPVPAQIQVTQFTARKGIFVYALLFCFWISDSEASESYKKDYPGKQNPGIRIQSDEFRFTRIRLQLLMWGATKNPRVGMKITLSQGYLGFDKRKKKSFGNFPYQTTNRMRP